MQAYLSNEVLADLAKTRFLLKYPECANAAQQYSLTLDMLIARFADVRPTLTVTPKDFYAQIKKSKQ